MAFDYTENKEYHCDYERFLKVIDIEPFKSVPEYKTFWLNTFMLLDNLNEPIGTLPIKECYQNRLMLNGSESNIYLLQFNIDEVLKDVCNLETQKLHRSYFETPNEIVHYTKAKPKDYHKSNSDPIILIEFAGTGKRKYLVIDGNHRLTYRLSTSVSHVDCILFQPNNNKYFVSRLDVAMYLFNLNSQMVMKEHCGENDILHVKNMIYQVIHSSTQCLFNSEIDTSTRCSNKKNIIFIFCNFIRSIRFFR